MKITILAMCFTALCFVACDELEDSASVEENPGEGDLDVDVDEAMRCGHIDQPCCWDGETCLGYSVTVDENGSCFCRRPCGDTCMDKGLSGPCQSAGSGEGVCLESTDLIPHPCDPDLAGQCTTPSGDQNGICEAGAPFNACLSRCTVYEDGCDGDHVCNEVWPDETDDGGEYPLMRYCVPLQ